MARIFFVVWPMFASVGCGLKLARDLRSRGHDVSYLGVPDCKQFVVPHGFQFIPLYASWLPETPTEPPDKIATSQTFWERFRSERARVRMVCALLDAVGSDREREFQDILTLTRPDLLIIHSCDFEVIIPSLLAYEAGIKSIYLYDNFALGEDSRVPPVTTAIVPGDGWLSSLRLRLAWKTLKIRRHIVGHIARLCGLTHEPALCRASRRIADRCGYPWELVEPTEAVLLKAHLPEIILCPRELEFIREERPGRYYLGCNIDLQRQEADFPWNLLGSRRLIYCSLGTVSWFDKATYQRFFQVILDVAATKSTFQWVISLYDVVNPEDFANVPSNVLLVKRAPQLALLRRCVIAIVHGGGNTTKECAYFGVPMVVFPLGLDQPGNAARVVYHGLGVRGDFSSVTADQMSALVDRVDRDSFFQMQARLMGERLRAADIGRSAVDFVEKLLSTPKVEKLLSARG